MGRLSIRKPDDSGDYYRTNIECETFDFGSDSVMSDRSHKDPLQAALTTWWKNKIQYNKRTRYLRRETSFDKTFNHLVKINGCPVLLSREGVRYSINGKAYNLVGISESLARLTFKSCFEDDPAILLSTLYSTLQLPENVKYSLENRLPYHWYDIHKEGINKIEVRLNCKQISDNEIAIEISDGVWGTMTLKQLDVFCNFYKNGMERGSWKNTSPMELFYKTVDRMPKPSEMEVMKAFLQQNRTQDLVESRAIDLVNEMLEEYPDRLKGVWENDKLIELHVRGKDYDWKLTNNGYKTDIQMVSTYVWQTVTDRKNTNAVDEKGNVIYEEQESEPDWQGPICIDNMAKGSSLGDQFAARALALLNDRFTITIVNTIKRYLNAKPNTNRVDMNDM